MEIESADKIPKVPTHSSDPSHEDNSSITPMSSLFNDTGFLVPTATVPTKRPLQPMGMIRLYVSGATKRLYIYNTVADTWNYTALT